MDTGYISSSFSAAATETGIPLSASPTSSCSSYVADVVSSYDRGSCRSDNGSNNNSRVGSIEATNEVGATSTQLAILAAEASLFGDSTPEGLRAIRELYFHTGHSYRRECVPHSPSAHSTDRRLPGGVAAELGRPRSSEVNQDWRRARYRDSMDSPLGAASNDRAGGSSALGAAGTGGDSAPAVHDGFHQQQQLVPEEVICEVANLYYAIDVPPAPAVGGGGGTVAGWSAGRYCRDLCRRNGNNRTGRSLSRRKALLQGVSCRVCAGEMIAVIGASGAGKSTFLDLLAGRKTDGVCAGDILLPCGRRGRRRGAGGRGQGGDSVREGRASVYVTQEDYHVAELTVRESLEFAVRLGMGEDVSEADRRARVDDLLEVLGLESCADVRVGNPLERGISGGQARRLSVGVGVVDLDSVRLLLLDEPTTGLDSSSAMEVLLLARRLATTANRRAVVASVHQPSADMFALFDKVLVLVGGRQVFFGSAAEASTLLSRPEIGVVPTQRQNPAEFILEAAKAAMLAGLVSSVTTPGRVALASRTGLLQSEDEKDDGGVDEMEEGRWPWAILRGLDGGREGGLGRLNLATWKSRLGGGQVSYAVGFWTQVRVVWGRAWTVQMRNTDALWAILVKNTMVGVLTAVVFWQEAAIGPDETLIEPLTGDVTPASSNVLALLYFAVLYGLTGHMQAIPEMFHSKRQFKRERSAGVYSTSVYWLVSATVHLPVIFGGFVVYLNMCYWELGLPEDVSQFFVFAGTTLMSTLLGYALAQCLAAGLETPQGAFSTWPILFVTAANFAGFSVRLPVVHVWFRWLCELSFCRWIFQLAVVNEFHDFREGTALLDLYFGGNRPSVATTTGIVIVFYVLAQLVSLVFLQPPRSRLQVLDEPQDWAVLSDDCHTLLPYDTSGAGSAGTIGGSVGVDIQEAAGGEEVRGATTIDSDVVGAGVVLRKNEKDSRLLEVASGSAGDGPLYYLEEGSSVGDSTASTPQDGEASLREPLLGVTQTREGVAGAGMRRGAQLAFSDLHYYIHLRDGGETSSAPLARPDAELNQGVGGQQGRAEAHVLRGVTGVVSPGQMTAILGPSGSGKTTLLDLLAGRKTPSYGRQEGDVIVDGVRRSQGTSDDRTSHTGSGNAYVMQDSAHLAGLTVRQTLMYAAKLRMPSSTTAQDRASRVSFMVAMLGLERVLDTKVGDASKRGISGGEVKRLSIAVEAMDLPGLLLLDEPTSGLDATTALEVLTGVRGLADLGRTVVISLHQPSPEMFGLLDTCLLLTRGGYPAYFGKASRAMEYFASIGLKPPPSCENDPAGFLLSVASAARSTDSSITDGDAVPDATDYTSVIDNSKDDDRDDDGDGGGSGSGEVAVDTGIGYVGKTIDASDGGGGGGGGGGGYVGAGGSARSGRFSVDSPHLAAELESAFRAWAEASATRAEVAGIVADADATSAGKAGPDGGGGAKRTKASMLWISWVLTHRQMTTMWQDATNIAITLGRYAFIGTFYGALWWQLGLGMVYERTGVIFFSLVFVLLGNQQNIPRIFQDRLLFYRERGAGVYGAAEYWCSIGFSPIPLSIMTSAVYGTLVYFMVGLNDDGWVPFGYFLLVIMLCNIIGLAFCQMLAAATRLEETAVALFPVALFFFIAFGGFIVRLPTLPEYLKAWAPPVSFARWAMEGLTINEFQGNEANIFPVPEGIPTTPEEIYQAFLEAYGFGKTGDADVRVRVLWILLANVVVFRLLTLAFLKYVNFERR